MGMIAASARPRTIASIELQHVGGALAVCDGAGCVVGASPGGRDLLSKMGIDLTTLPAPLTPDLWSVVCARNVGEAAQWRAGPDGDLLLGCTRYHCGDDAWLLVMSEISQKQTALALRIHQQRLESLGRVVATTVHDLRAPLSSVIFGIDVLATRGDELSPERMREIVSDVHTAAFRLRATIDCLMDFMRVGPPQPGDVSINQVLSRLQSLVRPQLRTGPHHLIVDTKDDVHVRGNLLLIEQIFINLIVNSIEAAVAPITIRISATTEDLWLRVVVEDNGPGIRSDDRYHVFGPLFTTKSDGVGLGLTSARESARAIGGDVQLVRWTNGAAFAVLLPLQTAVVAA